MLRFVAVPNIPFRVQCDVKNEVPAKKILAKEILVRNEVS
jgi:hypothetical protein